MMSSGVQSHSSLKVQFRHTHGVWSSMPAVHSNILQKAWGAMFLEQTQMWDELC